MSSLIRRGLVAVILMLTASEFAQAQFVEGPSGSLGYWNGRNYTYVYPRYFYGVGYTIAVPNGYMWLGADGRVHGSWQDPGSGAGILTDANRDNRRIDPRSRRPTQPGTPRTLPRPNGRPPFGRPGDSPGRGPFLQRPRR